MSLKIKEGVSSSSSSRVWWKYDVFVSFRGDDTRKNFTDHLCKTLIQKGIIIFRDDQKLERGKPISQELLKAIEQSRFSIVVFSKNYATSSWCLDELVKIVECMKDIGQTVVPIFYDVNPTEVRKQTGSFEKAFQEHEKAFGAEKLQKWRTTLTEVANLSGWDLQDRHEATFIENVVEEIWTKLGHLFPGVFKGLVGIDSRLKEMISFLDLGVHDVRVIGICGMGGIGKTTIAKVIYDLFSHQFEGSSFLSNVKESHEKYGLEALQEKLLSQTLMVKDMKILDVYKGINKWLRNKRVLIILDDVDKLEQLKTLVGDHEWFGSGSRIIITTRDEHLLNAHGVDTIYKTQILKNEEALQLFNLNAFKPNYPIEDFMELSKEIVSYANGLPLALVVLGSFLCGRSANEWRSAIKRLGETLESDIFDVLKISYDGLKEIEKNIFLDIACLFNLKKVNQVIEILDACDFYPEIGLRVLIDKSLVSIDGNENKYLHVHSLLQEMAWTIVYQESPKRLGKRSRLWLYNDIYHVLTTKTGSETVEVIYGSSSQSKETSLDADAFAGMNNLRLLKIHDMQLPGGLSFLSNELRILKWHGYPLKSLPPTFKPEKLVELHMSHSGIELLWKERVDLHKLKVIKLNHSRKLTTTPDFGGFPKLERLILEGCTSLYEVHPSIGNLERLSVLNLKDCESLQSLPSMVSGWRSLKVLLLLGCSKLDRLPDNLGDCVNLEELDAGKTAIIEPPSSIVNLKKLKTLSFRGCKGQTPKSRWLVSWLPGGGSSSSTFSLPSQVAGLRSLTNLDLSYCNLSEGKFPSDFGNLTSLKRVNLGGNQFVSLPESFKKLSKLYYLNLEDCQKLRTLTELPSSIQTLSAPNCPLLKTLVGPLGKGLQSRHFSLENCFKLSENQDEDVALSLLKEHLFLLAKTRIRSMFSLFLDFFENRESNDPHIASLAKFIRSWMSYLPPEAPCSFNALPELDIIRPGSAIPEWFIFQTTNNCFLSLFPPNWNSDRTFLGLAVCAAFGVNEQNGAEKTCYEYGFHLNEQGNFPFQSKEHLSGNRLPVSDHLWLFFLSPRVTYPPETYWHCFMGAFRIQGGLEFKKCGARAVFLEDVEFVQTMFRGLNVPRLEDIVQLSQPQEAGSTLIEHSRDVYISNNLVELAVTLLIQAFASRSSSSDEDGQDTGESIDPMIDPKGKRIVE